MVAQIPSTKGQIHAEFVDHIEELREQGAKIAAAAQKRAQRPWQVPAKQTTTLTDIEGLSSGFSRDNANVNYEEVMQSGTSPGTVGDVMSLGTQIDHMAAAERAYRLRHATPIRAAVLSSSRRAGHGHSQGVLGSVKTLAENQLQQGGSTQSSSQTLNPIPSATAPSSDCGTPVLPSELETPPDQDMLGG